MFETALAGCDKKITDPIVEWGNKIQDLTKRSDWDTESKKIYDDNKEKIDEDFGYEYKAWDNGVYFDAGMFSGRVDNIFIKNYPPATVRFFHPFI